MVMLMTAILAIAVIGCGNDAGASNRSSSDQTADEELEMLNAEINAMIEAEQRAEEEREQQLEEGYPEGVFPVARYICRDLLDEESDIFIDKNVRGEFDAGDRHFQYIYNADTKIYTILDYETEGYGGDQWHHLEGFLNDEGDFVVTYYARYNKDILFDTVGTITGENMFERFEEEHPEVAEVVKDDIEWVYVIYE